MARILSGSIDLNKIDKSKIVTTDKNGNPFQNGAKYLNVQVTINDEQDQYGNDASVSINQTKEERESGVKKTYIGNLKQVWSNEGNTAHPTPKLEPANAEGEPDLPF